MHLSHLHIENLRSIADAQLTLNAPGTPGLAVPNVNVLLGDNGAGKTTVLRAMALAALGPALAYSSGFIPDNLIRRLPGPTAPAAKSGKATKGSKPAKAVRSIESGQATATVHLAKEELPAGANALARKPLALTGRIERVGDAERLAWSMTDSKLAGLVEKTQYDLSSRAFFAVGYGATRRVELSTSGDTSARQKARSNHYQRVAGLFEEGMTLVPLSLWLPGYARQNRGRHTQVIHLLNRLMPPACRIQDKATDTPTGTEHLFEMNGVALPFRALSDGYRAYIGWVGDMLYHLCMGAPSGGKLVDTRGLVLVDEIDLHLHPEWQRSVVPLLAASLPHMQFVITTHSPLVVASMESANLYMLGSEDGATRIHRLPERVQGRTAEQILLSPYFGLQSTRAPAVADAMKDLARSAAGGDAAASLAYLKALSSGVLPDADPKAPARRTRKGVAPR